MPNRTLHSSGEKRWVGDGRRLQRSCVPIRPMVHLLLCISPMCRPPYPRPLRSFLLF
jgi:hypothetical protein